MGIEWVLPFEYMIGVIVCLMVACAAVVCLVERRLEETDDADLEERIREEWYRGQEK